MDRVSISTVFGPSHVVRWHDHVKNGVIKSEFSSEQLKGQGGLPIWSKSLFQNASDKVNGGENIAILVGDFRFGNSICLENVNNKEILRDGFLSINPKAIREDYDLLLFNRSISALNLLQRTLGDQVTFIFWDLFCRQIQDRLAGNYIVEFSYKHPIWNYQYIPKILPDLNQINLGALLTMPMHEVNRLFIDSSLHPSQIGYYFLNNLLGKKASALDSYRLAISQFEQELSASLPKALIQEEKIFLLTGNSIWIDTLIQILGANGQLRLARSGLIVAMPKPMPGRLSIKELSNKIEKKPQLLAIISSKFLNDDKDFANYFRKSISDLAHTPYINWEIEAEHIICARGVTPNFKHGSNLQDTVKNISPLNLLTSMVELGPSGAPSMAGIKYILDFIVKNYL